MVSMSAHWAESLSAPRLADDDFRVCATCLTPAQSDAACASSLAAIYLAARELATGACDMAIAGGCDTVQNPFGYLCFSKTGARAIANRCSV